MFVYSLRECTHNVNYFYKNSFFMDQSIFFDGERNVNSSDKQA